MDRVRLETSIKDEFNQVATALASSSSGSLQDMARMERAIYDAMNGLKAKVLQAWVQAAQDDSDRPSCPRCDGKMRQKQRVDKTCICEGGQVTVARTRWWCDACKASFFPSGQHGDGGGSSDHAGGGQDGSGRSGGASV